MDGIRNLNDSTARRPVRNGRSESRSDIHRRFVGFLLDASTNVSLLACGHEYTIVAVPTLLTLSAEVYLADNHGVNKTIQTSCF
jgi:hypothetical protein